MKHTWLVLALVWLLGVLDFGVAPHMALLGVRPDFLLVGTIAFSQIFPRPGSAGIGFLCGLVRGAIVGANLTHYVLSRTLTGFIGSWFRSSQRGQSALQMFITVVIGTFFAHLVFLMTAAPSNVATFLTDTIIAAIYNGVIAMPMYVLLSKFLGLNSRQRL
ncbi:MAG: rod shape-determining protein MreD [Fimbriimonadaceae bacterium]